MNPAQLAKEMADTGAYLASRGNLSDANSSAVSLRENIADTMSKQISALYTFTPSDASLLHDVVSRNPYGPDFTTRVVNNIDSRLQAESHAPVGGDNKVPHYLRLSKRNPLIIFQSLPIR